MDIERDQKGEREMKLLPACIERPDLLDRQELIDAMQMVSFAIGNRHLVDQLEQLHNSGPLWDGDVLSKADRTALLEGGYCAKIVQQGESGYNACTYKGAELLSIYKAISA